MDAGDFRLGKTFDVKFTTINSSGAPITLAGSPAVAAYPDNSTTEITAGITLTVDFDARTGLHNVRVVATSGNGYATATNYQLVLTAGTVDGTSVVGYVVGHFSIENRSALMPTTVDRTLDVSAAGEAGLDWANVGSQSTAVNLSATTVNLVNTVTTLTNLPAITANWLTAAGIAADVTTELRALVSGTSDSGTTTTMVDAARTEADTDYWKGAYILFTSGTIAGQCRLITGFNAATDEITFSPGTTQAVSTHTYEILPAASSNVELWRGDTPFALSSGGYVQVDTVMVESSDATNQIQTAAQVGANAALVAFPAATSTELDKVPKSDGATGWNATARAQIQTEAEDALIANNLDHLVKIAVDTDFATTVHLDSVIGQLADNGTTATFDRTTDSLEAARDNIGTAGAGLTAADDAVITLIGVAGAGLTDLGGMSTTMKAQVNAEALDVINVDTLIDGKTIVAAVQYVSASVAGRVSGAGTGTEVFKGLDESTTRLTITVDSSGNRTDVTYG